MLNAGKKNNELKIREDVMGNVRVGAKEMIASGLGGVMEIMKEGNKYRKVGSTKMNERSSRSHTIFRIVSVFLCSCNV